MKVRDFRLELSAGMEDALIQVITSEGVVYDPTGVTVEYDEDSDSFTVWVNIEPV